MVKGHNMHAKGTTTISSWDEKTWDGKAWNEVEGRKLTHAVVKQSFAGDIQAESTVHYQMFYGDDVATFVGLQEVIGSIGVRSGKFVLQITGIFKDGEPKADFTVIPNSGTDELLGLKGSGTFITVDKNFAYTLDYDFD
jgi:hypothetical protein